jgi:hypothetical protein
MRAIAFFLCAIVVVSPLSAQQQVIMDLPEVRGPFTPTAPTAGSCDDLT